MEDGTTQDVQPKGTWVGATEKVPPHAFFLVSAVFHYLGPAFAVLLFAHVSVLGVAWLRIATAALVFAVWRRPWRLVGGWSWPQRRTLVALGVVLGTMNATFYLAIARLPLGTVGAIEFLGTVVLAAVGARTRRNVSALGLAAVGVWFLTDVRLAGEPLGFAFAFANGALFLLYIVLGHRIAGDGDGEGIDRLGAAMLVALVTVGPLGIVGAAPAFADPELLLAGVGVGVCSSVIPYVSDQFAMARLPRATFALLLATLPAWAALIGVAVLRQVPAAAEIVGVALVVAGVAVHQRPNGRTGGAPNAGGSEVARRSVRHPTVVAGPRRSIGTIARSRRVTRTSGGMPGGGAEGMVADQAARRPSRRGDREEERRDAPPQCSSAPRRRTRTLVLLTTRNWFGCGAERVSTWSSHSILVESSA